MKSKTFIFFGRSGSGKGTQAKLLVEALEQENREVVYVETGQEFRNFIVKENNHTADLTKKVLDEGGLLPAFLPVWIWSRMFIHNFDGSQDLVLDGLARRIAEAPVLDSALKFYGRNENVVIMNIDISKDEARKRLLSRGREDDNNKDIDERLAWYDRDVLPVLEYFEERKGYHYFNINGEQSVKDVQKEIQEAIASIG